LLLGPTALEPPAGVTVVRFTTAEELLECALENAVGADVIVATAAVADWRPAERSAQKVKKSDADENVRLVRTPDVLAALAQRKGNSFLVGFAAETSDHEANAREKLARKHLDAIVVNDVSGERGFGAVITTLTLLYGDDGRIELGTGRKDALAARFLDAIVPLVENA
jgi:phosphopantothenoylcysteine decarboxylase/phosphopantothenate--cysteine ligase